MSKLFETLEKIQRIEPAPAGPSISANGMENKTKQWHKFLPFLLLTVAVVLVVSFYTTRNQSALIIQVKKPVEAKNEQDRTPTELTVVAEDNTLLSPEPETRTAYQQMVDLNNQGTRFLTKNRYWQSIYYFDKARKIQPQSVEPVINLAVALSELGLTGPANRFFTKAREIDPEHPVLRENMIIASKKGILHTTMTLEVSLPDFEEQ